MDEFNKDLFNKYLLSNEHYEQVEASLQDLNAKNDRGYTLLHAACRSRGKNSRIVKMLLERGADVNAADPDGFTPLHFAVAHRGCDNVVALIEKGASLTARDSIGRTALHFAIGVKTYTSPHPSFEIPCDLWIVEKLLCESEMLLNVVDGEGKTPLAWAVAENCLDVVVYLLKKGANPNISDNNSQTPLHHALSAPAPNEHIVIELIKAGACIYCADNTGQTVVDILLLASSDSALQLATKCIWWIALCLQSTKILKHKLEKVSVLSQTYERCCREVKLMKRVILHDKFTLHDFVVGSFQCEDKLGINSKVVEILLSGILTEYFYLILNLFSVQDLGNVLEIFTDKAYVESILNLTRPFMFSMIRYQYSLNVDLRRRLFNWIEKLYSIYQKC